MALISDGNFEIGAHVVANLCSLISLRHLRDVTNRMFFSPKRPTFLHACATCSEIPSDITTKPFLEYLLPIESALYEKMKEHDTLL